MKTFVRQLMSSRLAKSMPSPVRDPIETEANAIGEAMRTLRAEMGS